MLAFTSNYLNDYAQPRLPRVNPALLYASATGDMGRVDYLPLNAVRWLTPPKEIAALVTATGTDRLEAELYHFGPRTRDDGRRTLLAPAWHVRRIAGRLRTTRCSTSRSK